MKTSTGQRRNSSKQKFAILVSVLVAAGVAPSCGHDLDYGAEEDEDIRDTTIVGNGARVFWGWPGVGEVAAGGRCTGTLIGARYVLTAKHCTKLKDVSKYRFKTHAGSRSRESVHRVERVFRHSSADLALLKLTQNAANVHRGIKVLRLSPDLMQTGQGILLMGYGRTSTTQSSDGNKRYVFARTSRVASNGKYFYYNQDHGKGGTCYGDSGGPTFVHTRGRGWRLVGVHLGGSKQCEGNGSFGNDTAVRPYRRWIDTWTGGQAQF